MCGEPVVSDPLDELAARDVISGGGEDFSAFAVSRWSGLVRLAFGLTGDRWAAEDLAQAALARAYVAWRRVSRADDPDAYLRRLLVDASNRRFRRHRVAEQPGDPAEIAVEGPADPMGESAVPLTAPVGVPAAPVDAIIRRGRGIRLRRAGVAVGGLGLAGIIAALLLTPPAPPPAPAPPAPLPAGETAGQGGVFARGVADGHAWWLAVQDIADPGYRCIPAVTINGTDADPVSPGAGNYADMALGPAAPGIGFTFLQLPAGVQRVVLDGQESLPATTATACGLRYRVVGFAYRLAHLPQITVVGRPGWPKLRAATGGATQNWPPVYQLPPIGSPVTDALTQGEGIWTNVGSTGAETARGVVASGPTWSITLLLDAGGDCYDFAAPVSFGSPQMGACGPVSTPDGAETIICLPLSYPPGAYNAATGYAVQVSPATARLRATASDGSSQLVTPRVVDGRRYAAFAIGASLRLTRLTWLDAAGREIASTTALPRYGYTQFQP
jgi:Sigma-70 region 2